MRKYSLHIGLNSVDKNLYRDKFKNLNNAEKDAEILYNIAIEKGFEAKKVVGDEANSFNFFKKLKNYTQKLDNGDLLFLSFSGHGTYIDDVLDEDEEDGSDEALVFYDRIVLDDEIKTFWPLFKTGVRIFFITDSCYNGTVSRLLEAPNEVLEIKGAVVKGIETDIANGFINGNKGFYTAIKILLDKEETSQCSVIHMAACQDDQKAIDQSADEGCSFFMAFFKLIYIENGFQGTYHEFFQELKNKMPSYHSPNFDNHAEGTSKDFKHFKFLD